MAIVMEEVSTLIQLKETKRSKTPTAASGRTTTSMELESKHTSMWAITMVTGRTATGTVKEL